MSPTSLITSALIVLSLVAVTRAQDRGIELVSGPAFQLSDRAVAAGIDGTFNVSFKVDRTGNVKSVKLLAGPIWPCDTSPNDEIKEVREAVKSHIMASKFSPAMKAGKPIEAEATLDFAIGDAYKEAVTGESRSKSRWVVDVASLQQKALSLPTPIAFRNMSGSATVRVLIGENGRVISAGAVRGHPVFHANSRRAACDARFPPTIVNGKPIKVTGLIHYEFSRGNVTVR